MVAKNKSEDLVEIVCHKMFFQDFTYRKPKFKKQSGQEKEFSDVLILYGDTALSFQVKSKEEGKPISEKEEKDLQRIKKKVEKGIGQINTPMLKHFSPNKCNYSWKGTCNEECYPYKIAQYKSLDCNNHGK